MSDTYNYYSAFAGIPDWLPPDWLHLVKLSVEVESTPRNNDMMKHNVCLNRERGLQLSVN